MVAAYQTDLKNLVHILDVLPALASGVSDPDRRIV
jgi:hypothetical protein